MNEIKSKGGRPRRTEERLQRITLNLRPTLLFGLEMVARHRRTSLSQAAEYLLLASLRPYELDGTTVFKTLETTISRLAAVGDWTETDENGVEVEISSEERELELQSRLLGTAGGRSLLMPNTLQTSSEQYFEKAFSVILSADLTEGKQLHPLIILFLPDVIDELFLQAKDFEEKGVAAEVAGGLMRDMAIFAMSTHNQELANLPQI